VHREVIRGHQGSSGVIRGHQRPSEAIRGHLPAERHSGQKKTGEGLSRRLCTS
jgi:hypothetical protein